MVISGRVVQVVQLVHVVRVVQDYQDYPNDVLLAPAKRTRARHLPQDDLDDGHLK